MPFKAKKVEKMIKNLIPLLDQDKANSNNQSSKGLAKKVRVLIRVISSSNLDWNLKRNFNWRKLKHWIVYRYPLHPL